MRTGSAVAESARLTPGTRVRLRAPAAGVTLRANTGTIVRPDEWGDYYIVRLDKPALYDHGTRQSEELHEIAELADNMDVLAQSSQARVRLPGGRVVFVLASAIADVLRRRRLVQGRLRWAESKKRRGSHW